MSKQTSYYGIVNVNVAHVDFVATALCKVEFIRMLATGEAGALQGAVTMLAWAGPSQLSRDACIVELGGVVGDTSWNSVAGGLFASE